jgi:hypothetical protein
MEAAILEVEPDLLRGEEPRGEQQDCQEPHVFIIAHQSSL